ncbi:MAG: PIN domain-containing protein [Planctomycetes bacterium]|nr:PIN domain-containing protein [Planctomycetota bacterium]
MTLLDTDICIGLLRGNPVVLERRRNEAGPVAISFISLGELYYGAEKSSARDANVALVEQFALTVHVLHSTPALMAKFGGLKAALEREGTPLPDADVLIASTAILFCDRFITGNVKHFSRFEGLRLENWLR